MLALADVACYAGTASAIGSPQLLTVSDRRGPILCVEEVTRPLDKGDSKGIFLVFGETSAVATLRFSGDGLSCGIGRRGYFFEVVDGEIPLEGGVIIGPLRWHFTGNEEYTWVYSPNYLGLGPIDLLLVDLDGDRIVDFKVVEYVDRGCSYFLALVRGEEKWQWAVTGTGYTCE